MRAAIIGERPAGMMTLETRPCHLVALPPAAALVEPITPPVSACDELDGMPNSQVTRFQMIPPARPAATTVRVTSFVLTRPLAIVAATASERNAPTRLSTPDRATATRGGSAPVAIEVAIALPVSWKPLVKSKARAVMTTRTRIAVFPTGIASLPGILLSRPSDERSSYCHLRVNFYSSECHLTEGGSLCLPGAAGGSGPEPNARSRSWCGRAE